MPNINVYYISFKVITLVECQMIYREPEEPTTTKKYFIFNDQFPGQGEFAFKLAEKRQQDFWTACTRLGGSQRMSQEYLYLLPQLLSTVLFPT